MAVTPSGNNHEHGRDAIADFDQLQFSFGPYSHAVYRGGLRSDPPVLIMPEIAGLSPGLLLFARRLIQARFQVYLPWLFGPFGQRAPVRNVLRLCVSREFANLRAGVSAPVADWLRGLAAYMSKENDDVRVGAIGMCLTGALAIPLVIDTHVAAAVAGQPAVPCSLLFAALGIGHGNGELNVSDDDIASARARLDSGDAHLMAVRFRADRLCPAEKMQRLREEFPVGLTVREYADDQWRNVEGRRPHATFTREYRVDPTAGPDQPATRAFTDLVAFFNTHLHRR